MESRETPEANTPLNITVTSGAQETMAWRNLARQAMPMLERPEQFHISQRKQLAQTILLLLNGDLELEHVFGSSEGDFGRGCRVKDQPDSDSQKESW